MIPIKIQIKNFLSYGNELQTVDFSPYHLLCLSGKNGHGKSALLDAITWAIWGQARKTSNTAKADHGLLRLGQTHMLVILDFECNNTHYRVRREFALTYGKPYAAIDFGIIDQANDTVVPLTEKTIRGTQQKIEETIHLDYESFINSAFLRQGQSNEFSKKSAKDRKEILANILGLQRYEHMRKLANDTSRQAAIEKQHMLALQENAAKELEKTADITQKLSATNILLEQHALHEAHIRTTIQTLQTERDLLIQQQQARDRLEKDIAELKQQQQTAQADLLSAVKEWRNFHAQSLRTGSLELLKEEQVKLTHALQSHQEALAKKLEYKELCLKEKEVMAQISHALKATQQETMHKAQLEAQQLRMQQTQEEQQLASLRLHEQQLKQTLITLEQEIALFTKQLADMPSEDIERIEKQFEKRRTCYQQWIAQANCLKAELDQLQQKKKFTQDEAAPSCPLCEQNLSASRKKFLKSQLEKDEHASAHRYNRLSRLICTLKPLLVAQHERITILKKAHTELQITRHKLHESEKKITELQQDMLNCLKAQADIVNSLALKSKTLADQEKAYATLQATLEQKMMQDPLYEKQLRAVKDCENRYNAIIYNAQVHQQCTQKLQETTAKLQAYEKLQADLASQQSRQRQIAQAVITLKKMNLRLRDLHTQHATFKLLTHALAAHATKEADIQEKLAQIQAEKDALMQQKGQHTQYLAMLAKLKEEHATRSARIQELTLAVDDYQAIAGALGKNGIQALLIEDAIPEIEHEANDLLGKLTDNQAHISIESLRDLKSGGTAETLDIKISDAAGIRAYELFSGGEAFRIDFALRIAISKLLARRAGTSLQTLIIDEGFGSQDDDGLSYIMDALYKIQDDFKKVIIVSHLPRLKDQFPVHFCVQKGPGGSMVKIIEQA